MRTRGQPIDRRDRGLGLDNPTLLTLNNSILTPNSDPNPNPDPNVNAYPAGVPHHATVLMFSSHSNHKGSDVGGESAES